jgi:2-iminobutanoate/2-iminopropanoate deaminase
VTEEIAMPRRAADIPTSAPLPFSVAVEGTPTFFLSGQVGEDPATGALVDGGAAAQARQLLTNVMAVLAALGKSEADVLRVGVYLVDMADFAAVNAVYEEFFTAPYPARTAIGVAALPLGALVEADVVVG